MWSGSRAQTSRSWTSLSSEQESFPGDSLMVEHSSSNCAFVQTANKLFVCLFFCFFLFNILKAHRKSFCLWIKTIKQLKFCTIRLFPSTCTYILIQFRTTGDVQCSILLYIQCTLTSYHLILMLRGDQTSRPVSDTSHLGSNSLSISAKTIVLPHFIDLTTKYSTISGGGGGETFEIDAHRCESYGQRKCFSFILPFLTCVCDIWWKSRIGWLNGVKMKKIPANRKRRKNKI